MQRTWSEGEKLRRQADWELSGMSAWVQDFSVKHRMHVQITLSLFRGGLHHAHTRSCAAIYPCMLCREAPTQTLPVFVCFRTFRSNSA